MLNLMSKCVFMDQYSSGAVLHFKYDVLPLYILFCRAEANIFPFCR